MENHDVSMGDTDDAIETIEMRRSNIDIPATTSTAFSSGVLGSISLPRAPVTISAANKVPVTTSTANGAASYSNAGPQLLARKDGPKPAKFANLPYATSQTGLVYDVRMRFHVETEPTDTDLHPEDPRRIHAIYTAFVDAGLAWREGDTGPSSDYYMGRIDARKVTEEEACLVHTRAHWNWIMSLSRRTSDELTHDVLQQYPGQALDSIYACTSTPFAAQLSAGGAIEACRAILLGKVKNVFAVIRPPGHHAEREDVKGFCFFDNVSIATKVCRREFPECRKVFILDWDVHHGNGIQQANYDDPNVLYISLHVHRIANGQVFYPEKSYRDNRPPYGDHLHCGKGAGIGKNVNIPWSRQGMGDADYLYAFQQVVMPIATEFNPDLVIIAAGFDAAEGDMLGGCHVSPTGYAHMTHMLMSLAGGKLAVCLEGGYNLESISRSALAVARTLMGEPPDRLVDTTPSNSGVEVVKQVARQQSKFWSCLYPKDLSARLAGPLHGVRMHNVIRDYQAKDLWDDHSMSPLFIQNNSLAKEFENQVLATDNYTGKRPLLVILHDPPQVLAKPDPVTGNIELHNTWLTDIVKSYITWAVEQGFAVIDVNLPRHMTDTSAESQEWTENDRIQARIDEATRLLTYLWENHIEINDATHIFLMGTNIGHGAIMNFIKAHETRAKDMVTQAISFVEDGPLISCKSQTDDTMHTWYYNSSLVFVSNNHSFWNTRYAGENGKRPKKRFGRISRSESASITDMLVEHQQLVFRSLLAESKGWEDMEDSEDEMQSRRLPPVANFALSPQKNMAVRGGSKSPTKLPPMNNFAPSPRP